MLDRYWHGETGRISPEAPVPVVRVGGEEMRLGGAANVALNLAAVGVETTLLGVIGDDAAGQQVVRLLAEAGVDERLIRSESHPSIAKLRVMSRNQQLIRLDFEQAFDQEDAFDQRRLARVFGEEMTQAGAVVFSDYNKGTLHRITDLIEQANRAGLPTLVDPKGTDWQPYSGATVLTPNMAEFRAVAGGVDADDQLADAARQLCDTLHLQSLLITRSERGMSLFSDQAPVHLPTSAREVFDVTGAGDTVIALLAAGIAAGQSQAQAAELANIGAGVVVGKLGTATVSPAELWRAVHYRHADEAGVLSEDILHQHMQEARAHGERVVMTNGCFDILHPGHIRYLKAARALGDWLVVAVNDDASVARLKGPHRPVNPVAQRMEVLAALDAVDWVVAFGEDTPERLICRLQPDVLVKGGDYQPEDVAGGDCVRDAGGEVRILDFVEGYSTTRIISRLQQE